MSSASLARPGRAAATSLDSATAACVVMAPMASPPSFLVMPRSDAIPVGGTGRAAEAAPSFSATLRGALEGVNQAQQRSGELVKAFELGEPGADLAKVMVASQQSQIAFRATVEVRNRLVQAYQDVMNMPV